MYWVDRLSTGQISVGIGLDRAFLNRLVTRLDDTIVDRAGEVIIANFGFVAGGENRLLQSTTIFSNTVNPGWHSFMYTRKGSVIELRIDEVLEDTLGVDVEKILTVPGPITIGGYGPPKEGQFSGLPWIGGLDRFAIDIGVAR
jgi:hypothetical protein